MYDVVAFDLDGTLIDSKPSIVYGLKKLSQSLGLPEPAAYDLRKLIGLPLTDIFTILKIDNLTYETHRSAYLARF